MKKIVCAAFGQPRQHALRTLMDLAPEGASVTVVGEEKLQLPKGLNYRCARQRIAPHLWPAPGLLSPGIAHWRTGC